jgi:sialate O-acetylesterase
MKPILAALLLAPLALSADTTLKLAGLFTDHMVLQRDQAVPVWGWAKPGEEVTVEFAARKKSAKADADGKWMVKLDPLTASAEPRELKAGDVVIRDVLVGDVWLCSGQSNMHFQMKSVAEAANEIEAAQDPDLRFFTVDHQFDRKPKDNVSGSWKPVSPGTAAGCSAVAYYFGRNLQQKLKTPIGLVVSSVGGTRIETWMSAETLASTGESGPLVEKWKQISPQEFESIGKTYSEFQRQRDQLHPQAVRAAREKGEPFPPEPKAPRLRCHDCPSALHNGMIAPLQPFAIRGAIWYQGESNSGQPGPYEKLLPAMIADWRKVWGDELPFLFVQLAPHRNTHPAFREAQHRIWQKTPHTAMAVTTDVGDAANIHPTRKRPVGERLALAARALSYGEKIGYSGPVFKNMKIINDRAVISFDHPGSGLMAKGGALKGFAIAGKDGRFVPATAVIEGSVVSVSSDKISKPAAVRYNWEMVPDGNLFNRDGLPAAPFRTDAQKDQAPAPEAN